MLFGELRTDIALHSGAFQSLHHLFLFGAKRVHRFLRGLRTGRRIADRLPPKLSELRIVRNVRTGWRPLDAGGRAVELDQTAKLRSALREALVANGGLADEGQT